VLRPRDSQIPLGFIERAAPTQATLCGKTCPSFHRMRYLARTLGSASCLERYPCTGNRHDNADRAQSDVDQRRADIRAAVNRRPKLYDVDSEECNINRTVSIWVHDPVRVVIPIRIAIEAAPRREPSYRQAFFPDAAPLPS